MRKPGSMVWKLNNIVAKLDKEKHEPTYIFDTAYDARKIKEKARGLYWKMRESEQANYNKAYEKCIKLALKELEYVTKK